MRLAPVGVIWMSAMMVLASGCIPASPLATFKSLVDAEELALRLNYPVIPLKFAFDVKKTDSLVSPYIGTINIDTTWRQFFDDGFVLEANMRISLAYAMQDGKWVYKNGEFVNNDWRVVKDTPKPYAKGLAYDMNKKAGIPKPFFGEMWHIVNENMSKTL